MTIGGVSSPRNDSRLASRVCMRNGGLGDAKSTFQVRMRKASSGVDVSVCGDWARLGDHDAIGWWKRNSGDAVRGKPDDTGRGGWVASGPKKDFRCLSIFFMIRKCMEGVVIEVGKLMRLQWTLTQAGLRFRATTHID